MNTKQDKEIRSGGGSLSTHSVWSRDASNNVCLRQHDRSEQEEITDAPESDQVIRLDRMIRSDQITSNKYKLD